MRDTIFKMIADTIDNTVDLCIGENTEQSEWDLTELMRCCSPSCR